MAHVHELISRLFIRLRTYKETLGTKRFIVATFLYGCLFIASALLIGAVLLLLTYIVSTPQNDRDWTTDQVILPEVTFDGDFVTIKNIRNFSYTSTSTYTPAYYNKTFNLTELETVDFIVEPLKPIAVAHTLLSFGFKNGEHLAISVEIRKEKGETYSPLKGLLDQFELMYVIADERDVLKLRAIHRKDELLLYPVQTSKEKVRELFVSMLTRAQTLSENPEFYNTLTSTCTTNIVDHVNAITENRIPSDLRIIFPLRSDEYAYELGLLDTSIPFSELRTKQRVDDIIETYADDADFGNTIRRVLRGEEIIPEPTVPEEVTPTPLPIAPEIPKEVMTEKPKTEAPRTELLAETHKETSSFSKDAILTAHNAVRKTVGTSPLSYSKTLEAGATIWADTLARDGCVMKHDPSTAYGENLYMMWRTGSQNAGLVSTPEGVVKAWADEVADYDYKTNSCKEGKQCGHYTQIVWNDTTEVGCSVASCKSGNRQTDMWVCRYSPPGNWVGEHPY